MKTTTIALALVLPALAACRSDDATTHASIAPPPPENALATFAGGCFWCMETPFEDLPGVSGVISGFSGGDVADPTYAQVCDGDTGHLESVQITFDPGVIAYEDLLEVFWRQIDPTDAGGQFVDRGTHYGTGIFYHDEAQRLAAEASRDALDASGRFEDPIVTPILSYDEFYAAEEYHQDFYEKSKLRYKMYRAGSGRDQFLDAVWGTERDYEPAGPEATSWRAFEKPSDEELRARLTDLQFSVTQEDDTERPFENEYWDNQAAGLYVDVVSGEPLFLSTDKFKSGTGWPSFTRPADPARLSTDTDYHIGYPRTEVRSALADSHLGHVFPDGPEPTGLRYCINSAALRFVPAEDLAEEGYAEYLDRFE